MRRRRASEGPRPRGASLSSWRASLACGTLALALASCSLPGEPGGGGWIGMPPVYPERQVSPAWSSFGMLAYCDLGITCVRASGGYQRDPTLAGVYLFDPATRRRKRIAGDDWWVAWHPTEPRLAYATPNSLVIADTSGAIERVVGVTSLPVALAWSPDGRWIAWAQTFRDQGLWIMSPDTGLARKMAPLPGPPAWGAASDTLLTLRAAPGDRTHVVAIAVATGAADTLLTVPLASWDLAAAPDGRSVVIAGRATGGSGPLELHRVDLASARLTTLTAGGGRYPAFRRGDGAIAYVRGHPWSIADTDNVVWMLAPGAPGAALLVPAWPNACK